MSTDVMDRIAVRKLNETAPNSTENWQDWPPDEGAECSAPATGGADAPAEREGRDGKIYLEVDLAAIVRRCRLRIAEQYKLHGDGHTLVALACSAIVLKAHIVAGSLVPSALGQLREVADNLGTTKRCGADVVETCIAVGAALFAELQAVYEARA